MRELPDATKGLAFMFMATLVLASMHGMVRYLGSDLHPFLIAFYRNLFGLVALSGVAVNNSIVLISFVNALREKGVNRLRAVMEAGQLRVRPILLTTATTVLGLIPLWLGGGPMFQPMAIVLIFGLLFGTVLTLCLVPLFYSLFFRVSFQP